MQSSVTGVRVTRALVILSIILAMTASSGCEAKKKAPDTRRGYGMGGVDQDVVIPRSAVENRPAPWNLSDPRSAVRSYLDWVSYGYRTADSDVASRTMTPQQYVHEDGYVQMNLQKEQVIDQSVTALTLGAPKIEGDRATVTTRETWTYRYAYISRAKAGKTKQGPFTARYENTYVLVKTGIGWVVDDIKVKQIGEAE